MIEGMQAANNRDAVALVRYFAFLEKTLKDGTAINEFDGAAKLLTFR